MDWRERFRAGDILAASRAEGDPRRGVVATDHAGTMEAFAWDVDTAELRRVSSSAAPVSDAAINSDGRWVVYHHALTDDGRGHLYRAPFEGGSAVDLTPDLDEYVAYLITARAGVVAALAVTAGSQNLLVVADGRAQLWPQGSPVLSLQFTEDGDRVVVGEAMDGIYGRTVVRSVADGSEVGRLDYSIPGASRGGLVAVAIHDAGWRRPAIWDPGSPPRRIEVGVPGDVTPTDWSPDGSQLVLLQAYRAQGSLLLHNMKDSTLTRLASPPGTADLWTRAELRNGKVTALWGDPTSPWSVIEADGENQQLLLRASTIHHFPGPDWRSVTFPSVGGGEVQGWLVTPDGPGPWPTIVFAHGGPTTVAVPNLNPICGAWVDEGFALLSVNYRGSTTFGDEYREALTGHVGEVDLDDMVAATRWLIDSGIAHPELIIANGWSYGGYLSLLVVGVHPELFAGAIAGVPIVDWTLSDEGHDAGVRAWADTLFGTDGDADERRRRASPTTYADRIAAPVLISAAEADSAAALAPIQAFVDELALAGKRARLEVRSGSHAGAGKEADIAMMESWLEFARSIVTARLG